MKSSIACLVVAGASAQFGYPTNAYGAYPGYARSAYRLPQNQYFGAAPAARFAPVAAPAARFAPVAAPAARVDAAAALANIPQEQVAAIKAEWVDVQGDAKKAAAKATKEELKSRRKYYKFLGSREGVSADDKDRYDSFAAQVKYQYKNTDANKAYDEFVANPSRATSLAAEAANADSNIALMEAFVGNGGEDDEFGKAGRYNYQMHSALTEHAEDGLKAAEMNLAINDDGAYFKALDDYKRAEEELWIHTFDMQDKDFASLQIQKQHYFEDYTNAWNEYAADPSQKNGESLSNQQLHFTSEWMDWKGTTESKRLNRLLEYQLAKQKAAFAKRDAQGIVPAFAARYQGLGGR